MSYTLWPHGLQHASLHCPSLSSRICSNSCPLNQWWHPTISSSAALFSMGFPGVSDGKESSHNGGDSGSIPGLGRSPGEGNGYTLQYSCLENFMDRGAWWAVVHGVTKSQIQVRNFHFHFWLKACSVVNYWIFDLEHSMAITLSTVPKVPTHPPLSYWCLHKPQQEWLSPYEGGSLGLKSRDS